jgi:hypothetical protein
LSLLARERVEPRSAAARAPAGRVLGLLVLVVAAAVLAVQVANAKDLIDVRSPLTAGFAKALVLFYGLAVAALVVAAGVLPRRLLALPVLAAAGLAALALLATLTVGAEAWSFAAAVLVMCACWLLGERLLRALGVPVLAAQLPVAWLAGSTVLGLALLFCGRAGLLRWWTFGVPVLLVGALGALLLARAAAAGPAQAAWRHVRSDRLSAGCASLGLLLLGLACVWTAAPDLMFDALYAKAWLPSEWARTGAIEPSRVHAVLNNAGFAQLIAVPGHLVDAGGIGRYLQWLAAGGVVATVWWTVRRSPWAPLCALAVAITPHLFWQASTAFDDALLTLVALGMAIAVLVSLQRPEAPALRQGFVLGVLAGACVDYKLHLAVLAAGLALGWLFARGGDRLRGLAGIAAGGLAAALPPFVLRWIDVGNPVLPAYNNIFKSPYWPPVNETLNFPFFPDGGPLDVGVKSFTDPALLMEAAPVGEFGFLVGAILIVIVAGWRRNDAAPGLRAVWFGLALATVAWYFQFRYLRYLLPSGAVAVVAIGLGLPGGVRSRKAELLALGAMALSAVMLWPSTVAQFWNVPGRDIPWEVALRLTGDHEYERTSMPERDALDAFNRVAPPGALAVGDPHQRLWLDDGRDLAPSWEISARLEIDGPQPTDRGELSRRLRSLGVGWAITGEGGSTLATPYAATMLDGHGVVVWADRGWTIYRLGGGPQQSTPVGACDDRFTGAPGCWQGTLDDQPGFRYEESPAGVTRVVPVCPGGTLRVDARTRGGQAPLVVAVDFDGSDPTRGHTFTQLAPGSTRPAAGTAPPGARNASVTLRPAPGMEVESARLSRVGACGR